MQNDTSIIEGSSFKELVLIYPFDQLKTENGYTGDFINNQRLFAYLSELTANENNNPSILDNISFNSTLNETDFVDGFYAYETVDLANGTLNGGKLDGNGTHDSSYLYYGNVLFINSSVLEYSLVYNYNVNGTIKLYLDPSYFIDGIFSKNETSSKVFPNLSIDDLIKDAFTIISNGATLAYGEDDNGGYVEINYNFTSPLLVEFNSNYLTFEDYSYTAKNGEKVPFTTSNSLITYNTNSKSFSMSYGEYRRILLDSNSTTDILVLKCNAKEDIKTTEFKFNTNIPNNITYSPKFNLSVVVGTNTYISQNSLEFNLGNYMSIELVNVLDSSDIIYISMYGRRSSNNPIIQFIYGQKLIENDAIFNITLIDFVKTKQYSNFSEAEHSINLLTVGANDNFAKTYLGFKSAYSENTTNTVFVDLTTNNGIYPIISTELKDSMLVNIETEAYNYINFAKDIYVSGNTAPQISITVYNSINDTIVVSLPVDNSSNYVFAYVNSGKTIKVNAQESITLEGADQPGQILYSSSNNISKGSFLNEINNISGRFTHSGSNPLENIKNTLKTMTLNNDVNLGRISDLTTSALNYTFVPDSNMLFIADYTGFDDIANKKIVVLISNGNASKYTSNLSNAISSNSSEYNFIFAATNIGSTVNFTQNVGDTKFSQKEIIDQNRNLYITGEDEYPTNKIDFSTYTDNQFTVYVKQAGSNQLALTAKTMPNKSSVSVYYAKQTILQTESSKETDYLYRADVTYFVPANLPVSSETNLYTLNKDGEMVLADKDNLSPNTIYFTNPAYEKGMAIHGITLHYNEKDYYILNNTIYENISTSDIIDFITEFGIYVNVDYSTYIVNLYWTNIEFGSSYKFVNGKLYRISGNSQTEVSAGDYHLEIFEESLRLVIREGTTNNSYNSTALSLSHLQTLTLPKENEELSNESNYIKKSVVMDLYLSDNGYAIFNPTTNSFDNVSDSEKVIASNITVTYEKVVRESVISVIFNTDIGTGNTALTAGTTYYLFNGKLYSDIACTELVNLPAELTIKYGAIVYNGSIFKLNNSTNRYENGNISYTLEQFESFGQHTKTNPTFEFNGVTVEASYNLSEYVYVDSIKVENTQYYVVNKKLYNDFPFNDDSLMSDIDGRNYVVFPETLTHIKTNSEGISSMAKYTLDSIESFSHIIYKYESNIINYNIDYNGNITYTDGSGNLIPNSEIRESKQALVKIDEIEDTLTATKDYVSNTDKVEYNTSNGRLDVNAVNSTIKSIKLSAYEGYYIKGIIIASNKEFKANSVLNYRVDSRSAQVLNGLQNEEVLSVFNYINYIPVNYLNPNFEYETNNGAFSSITLNLDIPFVGDFEILAVYAPIIYSINVTKVNVQDILKKEEDDATKDYLDINDVYENYFDTESEVQNASTGYIKGTLLAEYASGSLIKAYAYNGNTFLGYSIGKDSASTTLETAYTSQNLDKNTNVQEVYKNKDYLTDPNYENGNLDLITSGNLESSKQYFMTNNMMNLQDQKVNLGKDTTMYNNIFLFNLKADLNIYVYYKAISYVVTIDIAEVGSGTYTGEDGSQTANDSYLSYTQDNILNEQYTENSFKNPAHILGNNLNLGTAVIDDGSGINYYIYNQVEDKDPYVYTLFDNYGRLITFDNKDGEKSSAVLSPILSKLIDFEKSREVGFLVYKGTSNGLKVPALERIRNGENLTQKTTFKYGNNETYTVYTDGKDDYIELSVVQYYTSLNGSSTTSVEGAYDGHTSLAYTQTYYYKVIPYHSEDTYLEYTNEYIEEEINGAEGLYIANSKLSTSLLNLDVSTISSELQIKSFTGKLNDQVVATNNKYVYSILNISNNGVSIDFAHLSDGSTKPVAYHVDASDVEISSNNRNYLVYKDPVTINGKSYRFAVVTGLLKEIERDDPNWWLFYTEDYISNLIANKEQYPNDYEAIMKIIVKSGSVDQNIAKNINHNISSTNIKYAFENIYDFVELSKDGNSYKLKDNLFTIQIGTETIINSSEFYENIDNTKDDNATTIVIEPSNEGGISTEKYYATFKLKFETISGIRYITSIVLTLEIFYDSTGSLPQVIINQQRGKQSSDSNIMDAGKIVNYDYMTNGDTTYKPTGNNEKAGTKADSISTGLNDSYYIAPNKQIEGFFGNIYVKSTVDPSIEYFEIPNLNVKVTLLYKLTTKQVNTDIVVYDGQNKDEYNKGNNSYQFNLSTTGNNALFENQNWTKLYNKHIVNFDRNTYNYSELSRTKPSDVFNYNTDEPDPNKPNIEKFDSLIAHYYVYVISNAYDIIAMLNHVAHNGSTESITKLAADMEFYIINYDPANFTVNGVVPEYVLGTTAPVAESSFTYREVYNFLREHATLLAQGGFDIKTLPNPDTDAKDGFLKIRKIDVFTAAKNGIDLNFLSLDFSQTDLITTSIELNEKFQKQNNQEGTIFWFIPAVLHANHAYAYVDYSVAEFSVSVSSNSFKTSVSPSYINDTIATGQEASNKLKDQSAFNKIAQYYRFDGGFTGTFQKLVGSSMCLSRADFSNYYGGSNGSTKVNSVTSTIHIHDYEWNEYEANANYAHDRLKTLMFTFDPLPFYDGLKAIISGLPGVGLIYNFVYDIATGNFDAILGDLVDGLLNTVTGGLLNFVDGILYAIDTKASLFVGGLVNSGQW